MYVEPSFTANHDILWQGRRNHCLNMNEISSVYSSARFDTWLTDYISGKLADEKHEKQLVSKLLPLLAGKLTQQALDTSKYLPCNSWHVLLVACKSFIPGFVFELCPPTCCGRSTDCRRLHLQQTPRWWSSLDEA